MNVENMNTVSNMVTNLGFPIAISILLLGVMIYGLKIIYEHIKSRETNYIELIKKYETDILELNKNMTSVLLSNTEALNGLKSTLDSRDKYLDAKLAAYTDTLEKMKDDLADTKLAIVELNSLLGKTNK